MPVCRNESTGELRSFVVIPADWSVVPGVRESIRRGFVHADTGEPYDPPAADPLFDAEAVVLAGSKNPDV